MLNSFKKIPMSLKWFWKIEHMNTQRATNLWIFFEVFFTIQTLWTYFFTSITSNDFQFEFTKMIIIEFLWLFYAFWHESISYNNIVIKRTNCHLYFIRTHTHTHKHKEKSAGTSGVGNREQNTIFCTDNAM